MALMDIVDQETRSRMMSRIGGKNTRPELVVRKLLHNAGLRFRLHVRKLPGKPDIVLARYKVAIFVNGCFWHAHHCSLFRIPSTNRDFWHNKIENNVQRDRTRIRQLMDGGWRVGIVWECSLRGRNRENFQALQHVLLDWIKAGKEGLYQTTVK